MASLLSESASTTRRDAPEGADPTHAIPSEVPCLVDHREAAPRDLKDVDEEEFAWMEARRQLASSEESLAKDYGAAAAREMVEALDSMGLGERLLGALNWPGVGTRHRAFAAWCQLQLESCSDGAGPASLASPAVSEGCSPP